jgi:dihydrofolate synthase/folylpolyglutamate synthase
VSTPTSDRVLERLGRLHPKLIDLSLGRVERLLAALGNPQDRLPPAVHVAGTNGKGSTIATLRACLEAGGYRVHTYTSPHLVRFHERIRLCGRLIEEEALIGLLEECERANGEAPITFFEITTAAAFLAFARTPADIVLLETGLGGRLDATNVIRRPAVTAITPISLDHQVFLGDTLGQIAGEKAGIIKSGVPAVIGPQPKEAEAVIASRAGELGAPLSLWGRDWSCEASEGDMRFSGVRWRLDLPLPALPGAHQIANAGAAIACLEQLREFRVTPEAIARGLRNIEWPARLQRLMRGPLVEAALPGWELWLDGGHNPGAGAVLADTIAGWRDLPLYLVVGMLNTKDAAGFLAPLAPYAKALAGVTIPGEQNPLPPDAIAAAARSVGMSATTAASVADALAEFSSQAASPARILICGSLHFAGTVLAANRWGSEAVAGLRLVKN